MSKSIPLIKTCIEKGIIGHKVGFKAGKVAANEKKSIDKKHKLQLVLKQSRDAKSTVCSRCSRLI